MEEDWLPDEALGFFRWANAHVHQRRALVFSSVYEIVKVLCNSPSAPSKNALFGKLFRMPAQQ